MIEEKSVDTLQGMKDYSLVGLSKQLLDASVKSTGILSLEEMTPQKLQEAKLVLGFLNATNSVMKTKINIFKMVGLDEKVQAIEEMSKRLKDVD